MSTINASTMTLSSVGETTTVRRRGTRARAGLRGQAPVDSVDRHRRSAQPPIARNARSQAALRRQRSAPRQRRPPSRLGPVDAMSASALHGQQRLAQGAKLMAGREPDETLQRSDGRCWQQPEGNERRGPPLCVVLLAKTSSLRFVVRLDWRPTALVRAFAHSVNRPCSMVVRKVSKGDHEGRIRSDRSSTARQVPCQRQR